MIVAPTDDLHGRAVSAQLTALGVQSRGFDSAELGRGAGITLAPGASGSAIVTTAGERIDLGSVRSVWWRRPRRPEPVWVGQADSGEDVPRFVDGEWEHTLDGMASVVPAIWVNDPAAQRRAGRKVHQLQLAADIGLRAPKTLISNSEADVREFLARVGPAIYKRIGSAPHPLAATMAVTEADLHRLPSLTSCPAIFQERIDARMDLRVTIIGAQVFSAEIYSQQGTSPLDWRFDHGVPFAIHRLDSTVAAQLQVLMRRLGLVYGAIDLRLTPEGEYVFLEVNPAGQFLFVEILTGLPIAAALAATLANSETVARTTLDARSVVVA